MLYTHQFAMQGKRFHTHPLQPKFPMRRVVGSPTADIKLRVWLLVPYSRRDHC